MQVSRTPQDGSDLSDLGSVEDAAGYNLRQQLKAAEQRLKAAEQRLKAAEAAAEQRLKAAEAELSACQAERDQARSERDQARGAGQRGEARLLQNAEVLRKARLRLRANAAARCRSERRSQRPPRGDFEIDPEYAVPSTVSQRGALDTQAMSTESISKEGRQRPATELLRGPVRKRSRL